MTEGFRRLPLFYKIGLIVIIILILGAGFFWVFTRSGQAPQDSSDRTNDTSYTGDTQDGTTPNPDASPTQSGESGSTGGSTNSPTKSGSGSGSGSKPGTSGGSSGGTGSSSGGSSSGSGSNSSGTGGNNNNGGNNGGDTTPPGTCPAFPAFPDANCTGWQHTGVTLQDCPTTLSTDGATYDSCRFDGGVVVAGNNITIKRSKVEGIVSPNWDANNSLRGATLIDVEIDGSAYPDPNGQAAIGLDNYTCIRCNVHHTGRGANFRNNVKIEDSYFHDFAYVNGAHQSGVGSNGGSNNIIRHSNIQCNGVGGSGCSGALVMYGDFDPIDNMLIEYNLFNTDGSFCTYAGSTGVASGKAYPHGTNVRYLNNRFGKKYYNSCGDLGPVTSWENNSGNVWSGNAWQDGSGAINP